MSCQCVKELPVIKFSRENDRCVLPSKEEGNAGYDLYIDPKWFEDNYSIFLDIYPNQTVMLSTGIRSIIPNDYYAQIQERGSTGIKAMKYGAGVIDASYRGVWNIVITNCSNKVIRLYGSEYYDSKYKLNSLFDYELYSINKAIAQMVLLPVPKVEVMKITPNEVLNDTTDRMEGKFGSTGK